MNEEEAKSILKNMDIGISGNAECKECIFDDETRCFRDGKDCQMIAIEIVLNLLEKKDEIIKNQSYTNKKMRKKLQGYRKLLKLKEKHLKKKDRQIEQYQNMLATNDMLHVIKCEKKDKMIDLMAEKFEDLKLARFKKEDGGEFMGKYRTYNKNDWKQHFERKVEE